MLFDPLNHILGTRNKVRLLRALAPLTRPVSGREAARLAGVSRQALRALDELAATGIVHRQETAGQHLYTFNHETRLAPAVLQLFDAERQRTSALFERLAGIISSAGPVTSAVLFGSAARGDDTPESDLDLMVLTAEIEPEAVYSVLVDASVTLEAEFGVRLSPVVLTLEQARRQQAEGDPLIRDVLRDARRVCGRPVEEVLRG
jgi:predicted nucleotidyltransferase